MFDVVLPEVFAKHEVWRIIEDSSGRIWIGSLNGVHLISEGRIVRYWQKARGGRALGRHPDGSVLVQMEEGLYVSSGDSLIPSFIHPRFAELRISDFAWSGPILWCATYGQGLVKIERGVLEVIGERNGLLTDNLYSIFVGAEETVWIGSIRGLSQLYELGIRNYSKEDGLIANTVQCFGEDRRGNIYVGGDQGISIVTRDVIHVLSQSMEGKPLRRVLAFAPTEGRSSVIAHLENGMEFRVSLVQDVPNAILMQPLVRAYTMKFKDRAGNQWVVKRDSGVSCIQKDGHILRWLVADGYPTREVMTTFEDPNGSIWCGTVGDGMLRFKGGRMRQYTVKDGLPSNKVDEIILHPGTQQLWIATNNGIARWRGDSAHPQVETFPELSSLRVREFGGIAVDRSGDLWFTSSIGVIRYDGKRFTRFSHDHGLLGVSPVGILVDQSGTVWVGGSNGASRIFPDLIRTTHIPPRVIFSKIESKLTDSLLNNAELRHDENDIRFQFFGLDLRYPHGMLYSYRLDGAGANWSPFSMQSDVRFPILAPGRYKFTVRAMNVWGSISPNAAEFAFSI
ncbi:MAG: two-component regulator propeller domain-containing protein, partial [Bacteroidota bacterium]